jgi:hypothetical protein
MLFIQDIACILLIIDILIYEIHLFETLISHSALTLRLIFMNLHIQAIKANHVNLHSMLV